MILKIGTRGSKLALAQSRWVKERIEAQYSHIRVELVEIKTTGDKIIGSPLSKIGGKGLFVKEIEEALMEGQVDVAVHSMKDVPTELPEGLMISTFPEREDPHDALVSLGDQPIDQVPKGSKVGTSSLRRAAQLLFVRPDLELAPLRGNIDTRLRKLKSGDLSAIVLAVSGLKRLGLTNRISQVIPYEHLLPAVGQGALALEVRTDNDETVEMLRFMNHEPSEITIKAERAFLRELEGGCQVPIAAFAHLDGQGLVVEGLVAEPDGSKLIRDDTSGEKGQAKELGITLARRLLNQGADRILERVYGKT